MSVSPSVEFSPFRLDPRDERLWRGDEVIPLSPKAFAVLHRLVTQAGRLVTKEALMDAVWPSIAISESTLTACIWQVRQALADTARNPRYLETVHGRGYRFIATVSESEASPPLPAPHAAGIPSPPATSASAIAASPTAPAPMPPRAERRQLTVMFCDLADATHLASQLDPEAWWAVLRQYQAASSAVIERFGGYVAQHPGDGLVVYFGWPLAFEDHAQRAVHAGLGIVEAMRGLNARLEPDHGLRLAVRIGIHTGLVVVGEMAAGARQEHLALGEVPYMASRIKGLALPDKVVMSAATYNLVQGYFVCEDLGQQALEGAGQPQPLYRGVRPSGAQGRLDIETERGLTPFVGRERELQHLQDRFAEAQTGRGQLIFLVGEAGMGKSRLLLEFRQRVSHEPITWLEGQCLSFGQTMALHPIVDLLHRTFQIEESASEPDIISSIERGVLNLSHDLRPTLPYLRALLNVDPGDATVQAMDPQLRRGEMFAALRHLLLQSVAQQPLVIVLEDIHWMDPASEAFLTFLVDSLPTSRMLCVLTYRPGYSQPFGDRTYYSRLVLPTLSAVDTVQMARSLMAAPEIPKSLETLLVQKTEGNPFFVEEVIKSLFEAEALQLDDDQHVLDTVPTALTVPNTIQDVLMARIDRLAEAPKQLLQSAAVIGREFSLRLLRTLMENHEEMETALQVLKANELLYEKAVFPDQIYLFKHALTQDVAYNSLLIQHRQERHRLIGQTIESLYADRLVEHYDALGYHFAKGEVWDKALNYLCKAAEKAVQAHAIRETVNLYDQALEAVNHLGSAVDAATPMAIHQARSNLYFILGDFERSRAEAERLLDIAHRTGDQSGEAMALANMGWATMWAEDFDNSLAYARQATEIATQVGAHAALARSTLTTGYIFSITARLEQGQEHLAQTLATSRSSGDVVHQSLALGLLGMLKNWTGEYGAGADFTTEAVRIAREHNLLVPLLRVLWQHGIPLVGEGNYDTALAVLEEGLALAEKVGDEAFIPRYLNTLGWLYIECGNLDRGLELSKVGADSARQRLHATGVEMTVYAEINRADALMAQGDLHAAGELLDWAYRIVRNPTTHDWMKWRYSTHLLGSLGELRLAGGDPASAREFANQSLDIARRTTSRKYLVRGWRLLGEIALAQRQLDEADQWLRQALSLGQTIANPPQLWRTHLTCGRLHADMKRPELARTAYRAARDVIERVKSNIQTSALRSGLEDTLLIHPFDELSPSA